MGQLGVPLAVYPWYLLCSLGILKGLQPIKYPRYRAYIGISQKGTLVGVHPTISWMLSSYYVLACEQKGWSFVHICSWKPHFQDTRHPLDLLRLFETMMGTCSLDGFLMGWFVSCKTPWFVPTGRSSFGMLWNKGIKHIWVECSTSFLYHVMVYCRSSYHAVFIPICVNPSHTTSMCLHDWLICARIGTETKGSHEVSTANSFGDQQTKPPNSWFPIVISTLCHHPVIHSNRGENPPWAAAFFFDVVTGNELQHLLVAECGWFESLTAWQCTTRIIQGLVVPREGSNWELPIGFDQHILAWKESILALNDSEHWHNMFKFHENSYAMVITMETVDKSSWQ